MKLHTLESFTNPTFGVDSLVESINIDKMSKIVDRKKSKEASLDFFRSTILLILSILIDSTKLSTPNVGLVKLSNV